MVVYEYKCRVCDEEFESPSRHDVSHCGKLAKRKFSLGGISFKGEGFYSTES